MKFLYARVSTEKQNAENQHEALLATVSIHDEYKLLVEIGSATSGTPPKLQECINNMRNGDTLVVVEPSRLGRKTSDLLSFIEDLKSRGVGLIILSLGNVDLHSAMGEAILTILTAISQMESKLMKERQARGIALARINNPEKYQGRARSFKLIAAK